MVFDGLRFVQNAGVKALPGIQFFVPAQQIVAGDDEIRLRPPIDQRGAVGGIAVSRSLLVWMNTPEEVLGDAVTYMKLYFGGVLFSVVYNMAAGILNAAGNSRRSVLYLACASITNIILDLVLIAGLKMGVAGAAIATDISQLVSCVLSLRFLMKVDADYTGIRSICDKGGPSNAGGSLLIVNEQNQILYSSGALLQEVDAEDVQKIVAYTEDDLFASDQGNYIVNRFVLPDCGITLLAVHSYAALMRPLQENLLKTVLACSGQHAVCGGVDRFLWSRASCGLYLTSFA